MQRDSDLIPWTLESNGDFPSWILAPNDDASSYLNFVAARVNIYSNFTPVMAKSAMWRTAEIGSTNGHGNARSIAKVLVIVSLGANGDGKHLIKPEIID